MFRSYKVIIKTPRQVKQKKRHHCVLPSEGRWQYGDVIMCKTCGMHYELKPRSGYVWGCWTSTEQLIH